MCTFGRRQKQGNIRQVAETHQAVAAPQEFNHQHNLPYDRQPIPHSHRHKRPELWPDFVAQAGDGLHAEHHKTAVETGKALQRVFRRLPEPAKRTVTFDNGGEFAEHEALSEQTGVQAFFCDPHSPWQRGTIENTNGIIRRDMPRKTDIENYTRADIDELTWAINSTPRKCLDFKTPAEAFLENLSVALEM